MKMSFKFINNKFYNKYKISNSFSFKNMILFSNMMYLTKINYFKSQINLLSNNESSLIEMGANSDIGSKGSDTLISLMKMLLGNGITLNQLSQILPMCRWVTGRATQLRLIELNKGSPLPLSS